MSVLLTVESGTPFRRPAGSIMAVYGIVGLSGIAALSWELVWQLEASLAIGVSARGTAITLAATMGGMAIGSLAMGAWLRGRSAPRPLRTYAWLELWIGAGGILILPGSQWLAQLDTLIWRQAPGLAPGLHLLGIAALVAVPTLAMGATVPVLARVAASYRLSLAGLYGSNLIGAALGVLLMTFVGLPEFGVRASCGVLVSINVLGAAAALLWPGGLTVKAVAEESLEPAAPATFSSGLSSLAAFSTGFATFGLEVAWFRSLRAAFQNTTDSFAIVLVSVLVPLAVGARLVPWAGRRGISLGVVMALAGIGVVCVTPIVERFDLLVVQLHLALGISGYWNALASWFGMSLIVLGVPMVLLGMPLPWLLEQQPNNSGRIYAANTFGAVVGSLVAAWILLPNLGFAKTAWGIGIAVVGVSIAFVGARARVAAGFGLSAALILAIGFESGVGRDRVQGWGHQQARILDYAEGPDSTVAVIEGAGARILVIDGFSASGNYAAGSAHYMEWMGRLPMLLHPDPKDALVICLGTGQTVKGVRREGAARIDVVDVSDAVVRMAPLFVVNEGVMDDPRVRTIVMDGRAWMRRTERRYDVVTLEPMPPGFAGVNALYSREFYQRVAEQMAPGGIAAQWVPLHTLPPNYSVSVVATFREIFPDAVLWVDPIAATGIVLGRKQTSGAPLGTNWPGFDRVGPGRDLEPAEIRQALLLMPSQLERYARGGRVITDDNQLISYGRMRTEQTVSPQQMVNANMRKILSAARGGGGQSGLRDP